MIKLYTNFYYPTEVHDVAKLFFADATLCAEICNADVTLLEIVEGNGYSYIATYGNITEKQYVDVSGQNELHVTRLRKRYAKLAIYNLLVKVTGKQMPWGSLTGIRPTKLADQLASEGLDWQKTFTDLLGVSEQKTRLVADILRTQGDLHARKDGCADLYVGIPFCVTRCSYCSFTSGELNRLQKYVEPYVVALCDDITQTLQFAKNNGIRINNVYFGGGTPTSLSAEQLDKVTVQIDRSHIDTSAFLLR